MMRKKIKKNKVLFYYDGVEKHLVCPNFVKTTTKIEVISKNRQERLKKR